MVGDVCASKIYQVLEKSNSSLCYNTPDIKSTYINDSLEYIYSVLKNNKGNQWVPNKGSGKSIHSFPLKKQLKMIEF